MVNNKIPFRCNLIIQLIENAEGLTPFQLYHNMKDSFQNESQCTIYGIDTQLMSLKSVGLVKIRDMFIDENDELISIYQITDYGLIRSKKYIGKFFI